jgi:hypothetical protein
LTKRLGPLAGEIALSALFGHPSLRRACVTRVGSAPLFWRPAAGRRGFTLLEALMASGILLTIVVAVTGAITAGQQHAYEAQLRIVGTLAADELLGRIASGDYSSLSAWNGFTEDVGEMTDLQGDLLPATFQMVGRQAEVALGMVSVPSLSVRVRGYTITVRSFDVHDRTLSEVNRFVPEPQS